MIKKLFTLLIIILSLFCFTNSFIVFADTNEFHTSNSSTFNEEDSFNDLNYGFYTVSYDNEYNKFQIGQENEAFDKNKPTMIFSHGYLNVGHDRRETLACKNNDWVETGDSYNLADHWLDKGYNVLSYYWNQFTAEPTPFSADAKIWSTNGPEKLRWRKANGTYSSDDDQSNPDVPIAVSYVNDYLEIFNDYNGSEIRIVGHSMGGMLSIAVMGLLYEKYQAGELDNSVIPQRLSLLDPWLGMNLPSDKTYDVYWKDSSDKFKNTSVETIRLVCKDYLKKLHNFGVAIDYYWGTPVGNFGLVNDDLGEDDFDISPYVTIIKYDTSLMTDAHCAVRDFYLYSINFNRVTDFTVEGSGNYAVSATSSSSEVYANSGNYFYSEPNDSLMPSDDNFVLTNSTYEPLSDIPGSISGFVFCDNNKNGIRDDGPNVGICDIEVSLYNSNNEFINSVKTNNLGYYSMNAPEAGDYYLIFDKKVGYDFIIATEEESEDILSQTNQEGKTALFAVASNNSNIYINSALCSKNYLTPLHIILYFVAGLILISALTLIICTYASKKNKSKSSDNTKTL